MHLDRARYVALVALLSVALAACSGDPEGSFNVPVRTEISAGRDRGIEPRFAVTLTREGQSDTYPVARFLEEARDEAHQEAGARTSACVNEQRRTRGPVLDTWRGGSERTATTSPSRGSRSTEGPRGNVVASWPGARRYGLVIGGHMDSVPGAPGANDNASGTAVVLELARIYAGTKQANFIRFVGFGAEEFGDDGRHHVGSQVYVKRLGTQGRNRLAGAISVDMIADGRPLLVGNSGIADDVLARTLFRKVRRTNIRVEYHTLCDCSDHGPFEHAGIPGAFVYSGPESNYHSPSDTVVNLQPRDVLRTGKAMRAFVKDVDLGMLRKLRRT